MLAATGVESEPVLLALLALLIHQERDYFFCAWCVFNQEEVHGVK